MKMKFFAVLGCVVQMAMVGIADEPKSATCRCACPCSSSVDKGIVAAIDLYIEGELYGYRFRHRAQFISCNRGIRLAADMRGIIDLRCVAAKTFVHIFDEHRGK